MSYKKLVERPAADLIANHPQQRDLLGDAAY